MDLIRSMAEFYERFYPKRCWGCAKDCDEFHAERLCLMCWLDRYAPDPADAE